MTVKSSIAFTALFAACWASTASSYRPSLNGEATDAFHSPKHEFPFQADIRFVGNHVCSGAVIGKYDVLTAAQCLHRLKHNNLTVVVGGRRGNSVHGVAKVQLHPLFDAVTLEYDAAIIKVHEPFQFGRNLDRVLIPEAGDELTAGGAALVGGRTVQMIDEDNQLIVANVTITSNEACSQHYADRQGIGEAMLCSAALPESAMTSGCLANLGAPLVVDGKLYGIASWGEGCTPESPNWVVYTDVSKLEYFLRRNTFIYENAASELCAALQLIISLLPMIPVIPAWVVTALNFLIMLLGC